MDPEVAVGKCRREGVMVATEALTPDADNFTPDVEDSGRSPTPHQSVMWAFTKK